MANEDLVHLRFPVRSEASAHGPGAVRRWPFILADVLRAHVGGQGYLTRLATGEARRHLDGSDAGPPKPGDVEGAAR